MITPTPRQRALIQRLSAIQPTKNPDLPQMLTVRSALESARAKIYAREMHLSAQLEISTMSRRRVEDLLKKLDEKIELKRRNLGRPEAVGRERPEPAEAARVTSTSTRRKKAEGIDEADRAVPGAEVRRNDEVLEDISDKSAHADEVPKGSAKANRSAGKPSTSKRQEKSAEG